MRTQHYPYSVAFAAAEESADFAVGAGGGSALSAPKAKNAPAGQKPGFPSPYAPYFPRKADKRGRIYSEMIETPEQLFAEHYDRFLAVAYKILRNHEDAEDCVQEASIDICRNWERRQPEKTLVWSTAVVWNRAFSQLRRRRTRRHGLHVGLQEIARRQEPASPSHEDAVIGRLVIIRCLSGAALTPTEHQSLMSWARGESDTSKSTEKVRAWRARVKLRMNGAVSAHPPGRRITPAPAQKKLLVWSVPYGSRPLR